MALEFLSTTKDRVVETVTERPVLGWVAGAVAVVGLGVAWAGGPTKAKRAVVRTGEGFWDSVVLGKSREQQVLEYVFAVRFGFLHIPAPRPPSAPRLPRRRGGRILPVFRSPHVVARAARGRGRRGERAQGHGRLRPGASLVRACVLAPRIRVRAVEAARLRVRSRHATSPSSSFVVFACYLAA